MYGLIFIAFSGKIQVGDCAEVFIFKVASGIFGSEAPALGIILSGKNQGSELNRARIERIAKPWGIADIQLSGADSKANPSTIEFVVHPSDI